MFRKILVGVDGSEAAHHALCSALGLARLAQARVHVVSVEERLHAYVGTTEEINAEVDYQNSYFAEVQRRAREMAEAQGIQLDATIVRGHAAEVLVTHARTGGFDLVVIGHTGHSRLHNLFLGSTTDRVVRHAHCPVLVVR